MSPVEVVGPAVDGDVLSVCPVEEVEVSLVEEVELDVGGGVGVAGPVGGAVASS